MSEYLIKSETLQDIANALREKTGETGTFKVQDFATEIREIQAGGGDIDGLIEGTLTEITSNATKLRRYAFAECRALTTASFPNVTSMNGEAFYYCTALTTASLPNVRSIGSKAFYYCTALTTASLPNATSIGMEAFYYCSKLTTASFPNATSIGTKAFKECNKLVTADFPNATSIGAEAFHHCTALTVVAFPKATSMGYNSSFYYCTALTTASFPNMTSIGTSSFQECYSLTKLIIGTKQSSVCTLASTSVFTNCYHILGTVNATYNPNGDKDGYIYVPNSLVANYRTATNWVTYATQIMPWVATREELDSIDNTLYDHACVGEGVDSIEYIYDGDSWRIFR